MEYVAPSFAPPYRVRVLAASTPAWYEASAEARGEALEQLARLFARALMPEPDLLVLDEPSAGLAPQAVDLIFEKIAAINSSGVAIVMVEQNARRALELSNRGYVFDTGRNRFEGPGDELLANPEIVDLYLGGAIAPPELSG